MSLNSVVNSLIRAASAIPTHISDVDLDKHVAKLLAEEAKAKEQSWKEMGLGAYLSRAEPDPRAPKPNKRFLAAVIRNVDGHNAAVIRQQNQAAREAREERRGETSRSGASRLFGGAMRGLGEEKARRGDVRGQGKGKERERERRSGWDDDGRDGREGRSGRRGWDVQEREDNYRYDDKRRSRRDEEDRYARSTRRYREEDDGSDRDRHIRRDNIDYEKGRRDEDDGRGRDKDGGTARTRERDRDTGWARETRDRRHRESSPHGRRHGDRPYSHDRLDDRDRKRPRSRSRDRDYRDKEDKTTSTSERRKDEDDKYNNKKYDNNDDTNDRNGGRVNNDEKSDKKRTRTKDTSSLPVETLPPPPPPPEDSPPPSPGPLPPPPKISRMDRYFQEEYDPRLDLGDVPASGPVVEVGWDNMLAVLKERGQKRRVKSPGLFEDEPTPSSRAKVRDEASYLDIDLDIAKYERAERKRRKEERKKRRLGEDDHEGETEEERKKRKEKEKLKKEMEEKVVIPGEEGLFDMAYVKKGGTREWDKGKEEV